MSMRVFIICKGVTGTNAFVPVTPLQIINTLIDMLPNAWR
jgi:hypothetical protein